MNITRSSKAIRAGAVKVLKMAQERLQCEPSSNHQAWAGLVWLLGVVEAAESEDA